MESGDCWELFDSWASTRQRARRGSGEVLSGVETGLRVLGGVCSREGGDDGLYGVPESSDGLQLQRRPLHASQRQPKATVKAQAMPAATSSNNSYPTLKLVQALILQHLSILLSLCSKLQPTEAAVSLSFCDRLPRLNKHFAQPYISSPPLTGHNTIC